MPGPGQTGREPERLVAVADRLGCGLAVGEDRQLDSVLAGVPARKGCDLEDLLLSLLEGDRVVAGRVNWVVARPCSVGCGEPARADRE